jgi:glycosyltransferase involved in cell wall biosynthesis
MKIIYLHQYFRFPSESGGTRSFDLASGFAGLGHQVEMLTSTSDEKYKTENRWVTLEQNGLVVHYIYLPYGNHLSYFQRSIVFFQFLWFSTVKLLSLKGDIVLATSTPLTIGVPALLKKWFHKTPFIFEARDVWPEAVIAIGALRNKILQKLLYLLEQLIYKNASVIVPLSVDMKHSIVSRNTKLGAKPIEVIENISEINRFQNGYLKEVSVLTRKIGITPRFSVLYAGTFGRVNGIEFIVALAEKLILVDPSIVFVLIGEGAEKNAIIQVAKDKGVLNKNIFILDSVSKQELPQLYYECSMGSSFVIPVKELWANSANKFFDTLASAKPILINHKGWQKEVIEKENIGYVLPDTISDECVASFALYTRNELLIADQKVNALNIAKEKYALDVAVLKYNTIFKGLNISCKK